MQKATIFIFVMFLCLRLSAQSLTAEQYIDTYKEMAIREMKRMGVPASITLAQGILESESGNSDLVKRSNNHFGIKCKGSWSGSSVSHDDDENGECFRKYNSAEESFRDHSNFLRAGERYAFLFRLAPTDFKGWAYGLKKAGYATNPAYPEILIRNIERYNLQQYTQIGASDVPVFDSSPYTDDKPEPKAVLTPATNDINGARSAVQVYSTDKTRFNGVKAINVPAGTSLLAVATEHNISLSRLLEYNDLKDDGLLKEEGWIFLEKKPARGNRDFYIAQKGETIHSIAQANGVQLGALLQYNGLNENDKVNAGDKILLRPADVEKLSQLSDVNIKLHKVQSKEGLYTISKKYDVTVQDLKEWNNLTSDDLRVGQQLIISK